MYSAPLQSSGSLNFAAARTDEFNKIPVIKSQASVCGKGKGATGTLIS